MASTSVNRIQNKNHLQVQQPQNSNSDTESFAEEERVFDFGEEDDANNNYYDTSIPPSVYREYGGEDYSQYLKDDDDPDGVITGDEGIVMEHQPVQNYQPQHPQDTSNVAQNNVEDEYHLYDTIQDVTEEPVRTQEVYQDQASIRSRNSEKSIGKQNRMSQIIKNQFEKAVNTLKSKSKRDSQTGEQKILYNSSNYVPPTDKNPNKIYNFSFADSKMGSSLAAMLQEQEQQASANGDVVEENADSGIGLESQSDATDVMDQVPGLQRASWWSLGTLSSTVSSTASKLKNAHKNETNESKLKNKLSSSTNHLNNSNKTTSDSWVKSQPNNATRTAENIWKKVTDTLTRKKSGKINGDKNLSYKIQGDEIKL